MIRVTVSRSVDWSALAVRWRALEARANASFFQSWTWTGCLAAERFPRPLLVEATEDGVPVALALFNQRDSACWPRLHLGETGVVALDRPYIEYNGVLCAAGREAALSAVCLRAALRTGVRPRQLQLSGIDDMTLAALRRVTGWVHVRHSQPTPFVDLDQVRRAGGDYLAGRSANTRQQLRRSERAYAAIGAVSLRRAATVAEAHALLDELRPLHQASWTARGEPGCFADPFFARFHHALIDRGMPRDEIALLRVTAGAQLIGVLYNFRYRGRELAYQSGFDYAAASGIQRPGLTCHHLAIRAALAQGLSAYDFLAGDDRYKRSLAGGAGMLHWVTAGPCWTPGALYDRLRRLLQPRDGR